MRVHEVMDRTIVAVQPWQSIAEVAQLMRDTGYSSLPIIDTDTLLGIITSTDITIRVVADGLDPHQEIAGMHMTNTVIAAEPDWLLPRAAEVMDRANIRRMPVVRDGLVVGQLSRSDIANAHRYLDDSESHA